MKLIQIKKRFRNGERLHHLIVPDEHTEEDIRGDVEDWAESDPGGQNYGYSVDFDDVSSNVELFKSVLSIKIANASRRIDHTRVSIEEMEKKLNSFLGVKKFLSVKEIANRYGESLYYEWCLPDGSEFVPRVGIVNAEFIREVEMGTIKNVEQ